MKIDGEEVVRLLQLFKNNTIEVHVDGGWGVDALLGKQTRQHSDLDIALSHKDVPRLRELLTAEGYQDVPRDDTSDYNFVMGTNKGEKIDIHSYIFDEEGNNIYGVPYEPKHLTGVGSINGYPVKCIPPDVMVAFHSGYELDENDYHDVKALCDRFSIPLPQEYKRFEDIILRKN